MPSDSHERARFLVDRDLLEGNSAEERRWLDSHLEQCLECSGYAALTTRSVRALDAFAFELDPAAAMRVENVVRERAARMSAGDLHPRTLWLGTAVAIGLTIAGTLALWQPAMWLAGRWNLPSPAWIVAFAAFWPVPSLLVAALPFLRARLYKEPDGQGETL